jgi:hypothetical protein
MIRVTCSNCGVQLNAKDELAGQSRKCPKCKTAIVIPLPDTPDPEEETIPLDDYDGPIAHVVPSSEGSRIEKATHEPRPEGDAQEIGLPHQDVPERLNRQNHYLICDKAHLFATWENNGQGWMLKTSFGLVQASRNFDQLPAQGDFKIVELKLNMTDGGLQLVGIRAYQLAQRHHVETPIVEQIHAALYEGRDPREAVRALMSRSVKPEHP